MTKPVFPRGMGRPIAAFRQADPADLPAMLAVIADAQLALRQQGVDQWQNGYPNEAALSEDIAAGGAYVLLRDSLVIATMALLPGPEPTYQVIDGRWLTGGPYCVIHRLAVHSHFKGAGAAARMLQEAEALCRLTLTAPMALANVALWDPAYLLWCWGVGLLWAAGSTAVGLALFVRREIR